MFDHVTIRVTDRDESERFYDAVLTELGIDRTYRTGAFSEWGDFQLTGADAITPVSRRLHVGFVAPSREQVASSGGWAPRPDTRTTARRGQGPSTATSTTGPSCSIRTATMSRS